METSRSRRSDWLIGGGIALTMLFVAAIFYGFPPWLATAGMWALGVPLILGGVVFLIWVAFALLGSVGLAVAAFARWVFGRITGQGPPI